MTTGTDPQKLPNPYSEDTNDELLRRMGALASIASFYTRQDNPERARSAQDDVDRCRREALRRMGDE